MRAHPRHVTATAFPLPRTYTTIIDSQPDIAHCGSAYSADHLHAKEWATDRSSQSPADDDDDYDDADDTVRYGVRVGCQFYAMARPDCTGVEFSGL